MYKTEPTAFEYFKRCLTDHYADFSGRARRSEYWYFILFQMIILIPCYVLGIIGAGSEIMALTILGFGLYALCVLAFIIPGLAVAVRRLHDTGRSGWFYLIGLIPLVGGIILIVFFAEDSKPGSNQWGPNPKEINPANDVIDHLESK